MKFIQTRYTKEQIIASLKRLNFQIFTDKLNIVFVRENFEFNNIFEDRLYLWSDKIPFCEFVVTTKAGKHWIENFTKKTGVAGLVENQYIDAYAIGLHRGYEALVQVRPVFVYRDANKDKKLDTALIEKAGADVGINYHTMNVSKVIRAKENNNGSAGCQVCPSTKDYFESMTIIKLTQQKFYTLTLLNKKLILGSW